MALSVLGLLAVSLAVQGVRAPAGPAGSSARAPVHPLSLDDVRREGLSMEPARYWEKMAGAAVKCSLCPAGCSIEEGSRGACRARWNHEGELFALTYARPLAVSPDPIEKKPLFHVLPGAGAFSIAAAGCNLGCVFCQNWTISQAFPEKSDFYVLLEGRLVHKKGFADNLPGGAAFSFVGPEVVARAAEANGCETVAYTYTEPTVFYEYMLDCAREARKRGLRNLWITCGYISEAPLRELCKWMDAANVDLKGFSERFYREYCGARLKPVLDALKVMKSEGLWVEITNLVIPGANDSDEMLRDLSRWVAVEMGPDTPLHFSRFHPDFKLTDRSPTPVKTLERAREIARAEGLRYVYIGNIPFKDGETTFCPSCGKALIVRRGFEVEKNVLKDGRCPSCSAAVAGIWK